MEVEIEGPLEGQGHVCREILADIPEWFGIPEANQNYAEETDRLPCFVARLDGQEVGFMTIKPHSPEASELLVLGVLKKYHRCGIGKKLLAACEAYMKANGTKFVQVKTLAAIANDPNYEKTRHFYTGQGYVTLEVFPELWDPHNPALQMIKYL